MLNLIFAHLIIIIMYVKEVHTVLNRINTSEGIRSFVANFAKQNGKQSEYSFDSSETKQVMLI